MGGGSLVATYIRGEKCGISAFFIFLFLFYFLMLPWLPRVFWLEDGHLLRLGQESWGFLCLVVLETHNFALRGCSCMFSSFLLDVKSEFVDFQFAKCRARPSRSEGGCQ